MTYSLSVAFFSTLHTELPPPYTHAHTTVMRKSPHQVTLLLHMQEEEERLH